MNSDISFAICKDCCPALPPDAPDAVKSFFVAVWRFAFDSVFIVPDLLCLFEIDAMFSFIAEVARPGIGVRLAQLALVALRGRSTEAQALAWASWYALFARFPPKLPTKARKSHERFGSCDFRASCIPATFRTPCRCRTRQHELLSCCHSSNN